MLILHVNTQVKTSVTRRFRSRFLESVLLLLRGATSTSSGDFVAPEYRYWWFVLNLISSLSKAKPLSLHVL